MKDNNALVKYIYEDINTINWQLQDIYFEISHCQTRMCTVQHLTSIWKRNFGFVLKPLQVILRKLCNQVFIIWWFSNLFLAAETTSTFETLRDIKNLRRKLIIITFRQNRTWTGEPRKFNWKWTLVEWEDEPEQVVDDLNPTEDGEASEKTHCASYQAQLGLHCHLWIYIINM